MIDLAQAGATILILGEVPVVLDAKAAHLIGTLFDVRDRIDVQVIHDVAAVIIDLDVGVSHFAGNLGTGHSGPGLAAVLLDDEQHMEILGYRSEFAEAFDPQLTIAALGVSEGQHVGHASGRRLAEAVGQHFHGPRIFRVDAGEHHHRFQSQVAAALGQFPGLVRCSILGQHRHLLAAVLLVRGAPGDMAVARRSNAPQRSLQGKVGVGQRHAGDLELGWADLVGRGHCLGSRPGPEPQGRSCRHEENFADRRYEDSSNDPPQMNSVLPGMATGGSGSFTFQSYLGGDRSSFEFRAISQVMGLPV